jgi:uncharacterized protein (UPF0548 family)
MLSLVKPRELEVQQFLDNQRQLALTYPEVGSTRGGIVPPGYGTDKVVEEIGRGRESFAKSVSLMKNWSEYGMDWIEVFPHGAELKPDSVVAVAAFVVGIWALNACRVIYVIDEETRFGFGYGTLPDHAEIGEERFLIEWHKDTDIVTYEILVFSNPSRWYYWLVFPLHRYAQDKFRRESIKLLKALVVQP